MTARKNRGSGNNNLKAWNSPFWDSIEKPTGGCKHLRITFKPEGQLCKDCEKIIKVGL